MQHEPQLFDIIIVNVRLSSELLAVIVLKLTTNESSTLDKKYSILGAAGVSENPRGEGSRKIIPSSLLYYSCN